MGTLLPPVPPLFKSSGSLTLLLPGSGLPHSSSPGRNVHTATWVFLRNLPALTQPTPHQALHPCIFFPSSRMCFPTHPQLLSSPHPQALPCFLPFVKFHQLQTAFTGPHRRAPLPHVPALTAARLSRSKLLPPGTTLLPLPPQPPDPPLPRLAQTQRPDPCRC